MLNLDRWIVAVLIILYTPGCSTPETTEEYLLRKTGYDQHIERYPEEREK